MLHLNKFTIDDQLHFTWNVHGWINYQILCILSILLKHNLSHHVLMVYYVYVFEHVINCCNMI